MPRLSVLAALLLAAALPATAQQPSPSEALPRAVKREVVRLYEEPHALRVFERTEIPAERVIEGNLSVVGGPLIVAGTVRGRILAINSDVVLRPGARVRDDILVVGGDLEGEREADIGGEIRRYRPALRHRREGDRIVVEEDAAEVEDDSWWGRWERRRDSRSSNRIFVASAGAYNRVEGLPINLGPVAEWRRPWGNVDAQAFAVLRTGSSFQGDTTDIGHDLGLQYASGSRSGVRVGGRLFNVNAPVESWQLSRLEYGLAAFLFRRDYQDFHGRHGGALQLSLFDERFGDVRLTYSHERWAPRGEHNPFTLFRGGAWRANPVMDAGRMHLLGAALQFDTRNDVESPWAGWYVQADVERGRGDLEALGPTPPGTRTAGTGRTRYTRGFVDARRYNRVGPNAQLNFRLVLGGWLGGDDLPLQRRLSVSGAGALPGFDFRTPVQAEDVGTCTGPVGSAPVVVAGTPALCDRIALGQVEYRGDLHFDLFGIDWGDTDSHLRNDATWVVFADAGRGWLVGPGDGSLHYGSGELPPPSTFRTDVGVGLDFGVFGVFVAKGLSDSGEPANVLVRLRHRF